MRISVKTTKKRELFEEKCQVKGGEGGGKPKREMNEAKEDKKKRSARRGDAKRKQKLRAREGGDES